MAYAKCSTTFSNTIHPNYLPEGPEKPDGQGTNTAKQALPPIAKSGDEEWMEVMQPISEISDVCDLGKQMENDGILIVNDWVALLIKWE